MLVPSSLLTSKSRIAAGSMKWAFPASTATDSVAQEGARLDMHGDRAILSKLGEEKNEEEFAKEKLISVSSNLTSR